MEEGGGSRPLTHLKLALRYMEGIGENVIWEFGRSSGLASTTSPWILRRKDALLHWFPAPA